VYVFVVPRVTFNPGQGYLSIPSNWRCKSQQKLRITGTI
jgi:hypothetical protein